MLQDEDEEAHQCYYSNIDDSYIGMEGMEDKLIFLANKNLIQVQNTRNNRDHTSNLGFNEQEQKWYGWSHRAIYGFGVGHEVKMGDVNYRASTKEGYLQYMINFWRDPHHHNVTGRENDDGTGVIIKWEYSDDVPNKKLVGNIGGSESRYPDEFGKGEWKAETLEDAKQMAIDYAEAIG